LNAVNIAYRANYQYVIGISQPNNVMYKLRNTKFKSRRLPPLNALRSFEAAGRLQSLTDAASELNVTPAAIGHQVKALEAYLERDLFQRRYRAIELTELGRMLLPGLTAGFDRMAESIDVIGALEQGRTVLITSCTSFASRWLVPRLDQFRVLQPDIDVRLDATQRLVDLRREEFDFGIRFGPGEWEPADLARHTLLHRDESPGPIPIDWRMWLQAAEVDNVDPDRGQRYNMESMAIQAALDGHGVALVSNVLTEADVTAGRLVRLFDIGLRTGGGLAYYLAYHPGRLRQPRVAAFREWLLSEAAKTQRLA